MRIKGKITSWNDDKGFGFIEPCSGGKSVFIHVKALSNRARRPAVGELITYSLSSDKQGRPCAKKALLAGDRQPTRRNTSRPIYSTYIAIFFLIFVGLAVITAKVPVIILILYFGASLFSFIMYAIDKSAAQKGNWRTQESTLHLLSVVGGWPGALVAQQQLRHKTTKQSFRSVFWITVLVNCGAFIWALTPGGAATVDSFIAMLR